MTTWQIRVILADIREIFCEHRVICSGSTGCVCQTSRGDSGCWMVETKLQMLYFGIRGLELRTAAEISIAISSYHMQIDTTKEQQQQTLISCLDDSLAYFGVPSLKTRRNSRMPSRVWRNSGRCPGELCACTISTASTTQEGWRGFGSCFPFSWNSSLSEWGFLKDIGSALPIQSAYTAIALIEEPS